MSLGPSPVFPAKAATPEFIAWFKARITELLPQTASILKEYGDHMPAMFVYPKDADTVPAIVPVPQFFRSNTGKDVATLLHRELANDDMVFAVIMITEAWVKLGVKHSGLAEDLKRVMETGLDQDPERQDAIIYNAQSKGMQLLATYLIKKPENEIVTPMALLMDTVEGVIEAADPKNITKGKLGLTMGRMMVPPKSDA